MAKDPAFLFYSQDFFLGVADLTYEERGQFITLLCLLHQKGRMKIETIRFMVGSVSVNLLSKFEVDGDGFYYNKRLESEVKKREMFTESRRKNGSKGGRPKDFKKSKPIGKPSANHKVNLMEDENVNEIENKNPIEIFENWTKELIETDFHFKEMLMSERIILTPERLVELLKDHENLLARYPKMQPQSIAAFRKSAIKHIKENKDKKNGQSNRKGKQERVYTPEDFKD